MNKTKIAIIGANGWVGRSMKQLFAIAYSYDPPAGLGDNKDWVNASDITFICVPTPSLREAKLDTSIIEDVISWCESPLIVIRSTVNPGDTDYWTKKYSKHIVVQPEYLGETPAHPMLNPKERPFLVIGGIPEDRKKLIDLYTEVYNANVSIRQVSALEAEVIKLSENRAIAFKVAQCQELYDVCEIAGLDYYTIQQAVYGDDPRFNLWFTMVFPDNRGMNSKCIPKDVYAWTAWADYLGYSAHITNMLLAKNKEWVESNG